MLSEAKHLLLLEHVGDKQILRGAGPERESRSFAALRMTSEGLRMTP